MYFNFLRSLFNSPFLRGMSSLFDLAGVMDNSVIPIAEDIKAIHEDWNTIRSDYRHNYSIKKDRTNGDKKPTSKKD